MQDILINLIDLKLAAVSYALNTEVRYELKLLISLMSRIVYLNEVPSFSNTRMKTEANII